MLNILIAKSNEFPNSLDPFKKKFNNVTLIELYLRESSPCTQEGIKPNLEFDKKLCSFDLIPDGSIVDCPRVIQTIRILERIIIFKPLLNLTF